MKINDKLQGSTVPHTGHINSQQSKSRANIVRTYMRYAWFYIQCAKISTVATEAIVLDSVHLGANAQQDTVELSVKKVSVT